MSNITQGGFQPQDANTTPKKAKPSVTINATMFWAELKRPNKLSGKYQVILGELSQDDVKKLEGLGLVVKYDSNKPERGDHITPKSQYEIPAYDKDGNEIEELIGNGSKAVARISAYTSKFNGETYPTIDRLGVTEMIPYATEGGNSSEFDEMMAEAF